MIFAPFSVQDPIDPNAYDWAMAAGIKNDSVIRIVSNFTETLKQQALWGKMVAIWPLVTDSNVNATAKEHFKYNLVNPNLYKTSYLNNLSTGSFGGWKNAGSDTINLAISPNTLGSNYCAGYYVISGASTADQIDFGVYDGGGEFMYVISGRNLSGGNAQILISPSSAGSAYNATNAGPFTGLFSAGGNGSQGFAYRRTSLLGGPSAYTATSRGDNNNFGLGSFFQTNNTAISPSTKTYGFCYVSNYLTTAEHGNLANAVNNMQGELDVLFGTTRKAY